MQAKNTPKKPKNAGATQSASQVRPLRTKESTFTARDTKRTKRVLIVSSERSNDAWSWHRGVGPLSAIEGNDFEIALPAGDVQWSDIMRADVVLLGNPFSLAYAEIANIAVRSGRKVWVDLDCNVFESPEYTPIRKIAFEQTIAAVKYCLGAASLVTVTTENLKNAVLEALPSAMNVTVVPTVWDNRLMPLKAKTFEPHKSILWMSDDASDLEKFLPVLQRIDRHYGDWHWLFIGPIDSYRVHSHIPKDRAGVMAPLPIMQHANAVQHSIQASLCLVPMSDTPYNRCRVPQQWLEATVAGCATIAPAWAEWKDTIPYDDTENGLLQAVMALNQQTMSTAYYKSIESVYRHHTLTSVAAQRRELVTALLDG